MEGVEMKFTHPGHLKLSRFLSPFRTPVQLHFSLPLTEIHSLRLAADCSSEIPEHVALMSVGSDTWRDDACGARGLADLAGTR
jgi:hypothetical protein